MTSSETQIANLLYRFAECIDEGRLSDAAGMFAAAQVLRRDHGGVQVLSSADLLEFWRGKIILHADGTPRTKHVVTNPIIDVDEVAGTAECRSTYVVLQQVGDSALQPVIAGRYHDRFTRSGGQWASSFRDYSLRDLVGDLTSHVRGG